MKSLRQNVARVLTVSVLSTTLTSLPMNTNLFGSSVVYAGETVEQVSVQQAIGTFVESYKKAKVASQQRKVIEAFAATASSFSQEDIKAAVITQAVESGDMSLYYEYQKAVQEGNINSLESLTQNAIDSNEGAAWAGCGVGVAGAILLGAGVIIAIVGLSKKVNAGNISERARQERQALTNKYEDDRYFIENSVEILEDEIQSVDLDIAAAVGNQAAATAEAAGLQTAIDILLANGADYNSPDVQTLVSERNAYLADADYYAQQILDLNQLRAELFQDLQFYSVEANRLNELAELEAAYNLAIQQNKDDEEADLELAPQRKEERKKLLIAAGIVGVLGGIGISSIGDCSDV